MPRYARRPVDEARSDRVLDRAPAVASRRLGAWRGWDRRVAWRNVAGRKAEAALYVRVCADVDRPMRRCDTQVAAGAAKIPLSAYSQHYAHCRSAVSYLSASALRFVRPLARMKR